MTALACVRGTVVVAGVGLIAGAEVSLIDRLTDSVRTVRSSDRGFFEFLYLEPDQLFELRVTHAGFLPSIQGIKSRITEDSFAASVLQPDPAAAEEVIPGLTSEQQAALDHAYEYHPPTPAQARRYRAVSNGAKFFEGLVLRMCPASADRSAAIRQIRDARMTANRSIALQQE